MLAFYGVADHQVKHTRVHIRKAIITTIFRVFQVIVLGILAAPIIIAFSPLFLLTKRVSQGKAKEALAGSKVKITGKDVVTTWKILTALALAPILWFFYSFLAFIIYYIKYDYNVGLKAGMITFIIIPLLSVATIGLSDLAVDVMKSIRPLIVSIGNVMSSSEPLREMRSDLKTKIRNIVDEFGPEVFPGFEETRTINHNSNDYNREAANKLGRAETFESTHLTKNRSSPMLDTLFDKALSKFDNI
jgi:glycerol-3-phosphate O-acyltransferase/dihydroxyacetone phosphate acyltransferase